MRGPPTKAVTANRMSSSRWQVAVEESLFRLMEGFSWQFLISLAGNCQTPNGLTNKKIGTDY
jgi:hypothetical protein